MTGGAPDCRTEEEGELLEDPIPGLAIDVSDGDTEGGLLLLGLPEPEVVTVTGPLGAEPPPLD